MPEVVLVSNIVEVIGLVCYCHMGLRLSHDRLAAVVHSSLMHIWYCADMANEAIDDKKLTGLGERMYLQI